MQLVELRAYCLSGLTTHCRELYSSASGNGYFMGSRLDWAVDGDEARIDPFTRTSLQSRVRTVTYLQHPTPLSLHRYLMRVPEPVVYDTVDGTVMVG